MNMLESGMTLKEAFKILDGDPELIRKYGNDTDSCISYQITSYQIARDEAILRIQNYIDFENIPRKKIEDKIEELNEGIKRDIENYDKIKDESWKKAIHHSITQKNESKKILQELLGGK